MKWNLRWAAAKRDIWRPSDLLKAFEEVGFTPSLSKVAALWSGKPISVRLDDLDKICAALGCTVADLLEAEPLAGADGAERSSGRPGQAARPAGLPGRRRGQADLAGRCRRTDHAVTDQELAGRAVPGLPGLGPDEAVAPAALRAPSGAGPSPARRACLRCGRVSHVSRDGLCRPCLQIIRTEDPRGCCDPVPGRPVQLALPPARRAPAEGVVAAPSRQPQGQAPAGDPRRCRSPPGRQWQWLAGQPPPQPLSPHLVDPAQAVLFEVRRDWSCLTVGELEPAARPHPCRQALVEEFDQQARLRGWNPRITQQRDQDPADPAGLDRSRRPHPRSRHQGAHGRPGTTIRRVLQFLRERGMVIPDPARQGTAVERTIQQRIQALPDAIAGEVRQWVKVVRGEGRRRAPRTARSPRSAATSTASIPVLASLGPARHQPARDHPRRHPRGTQRTAARHRPQPAARPAQPVPGAQAGTDHLPRPDPRDHPAGDAAPARPDPRRPAPRADRPGQTTRWPN